MANHVAGSIYERYDKDIERAKRHYQMAGEQGAYGAYMDLIRLKYRKVNHSYISEYHYGFSPYKVSLIEVPLFASAQTIYSLWQCNKFGNVHRA